MLSRRVLALLLYPTDITQRTVVASSLVPPWHANVCFAARARPRMYVAFVVPPYIPPERICCGSGDTRTHPQTASHLPAPRTRANAVTRWDRATTPPEMPGWLAHERSQSALRSSPRFSASDLGVRRRGCSTHNAARDNVSRRSLRWHPLWQCWRAPSVGHSRQPRIAHAAPTHTNNRQTPTAILPDTGHELRADRWRAEPTAVCEPDDVSRATTGGTYPEAAAARPPPDGGPSRPGRSPCPPSRSPTALGSAHALEARTPRPAANTSVASLRCVSANVQRSQANTSILLERHADADIVCIQEAFWGFIKLVPSAENPDGTPYHNAVSHGNFMCLGAAPDSRVAVYVNRRWAHASPRVHRGTVTHPDVLVVTLHFTSGDFTLINVYNDSASHAAVEFLLDRYTSLPPIAFLAGDFNLRHPMWDDSERVRHHPNPQPKRRQCDELIQLATMELGLSLLNDPCGPPTWISNNVSARPGVLDLVWVDPALGTYDPLQVLLHDRALSDHAVLSWLVPITPETDSTPRVKRDTEAAAEFIDDIGRKIAELPTDFQTKDDLVRVADRLQDVLHTAWNDHATIPRRSKHSKAWWNQECTDSAHAARDAKARAAECRYALRSATADSNANRDGDVDLATAVASAEEEAAAASHALKLAARRAKKTYFSDLVQNAESQDIWKFVQWTKPRKLDSTTTINRGDGAPASSLEEIREAFQNQFTPANPHPVDESFLDSVPQLPERDFPPIAIAEIADSLRDTSNSSAPGPDHISWFWLKRLVKRHPGTLAFLAALFTASVRLGVHLPLFKVSVTVIIPKPNKPDYTAPKAYRPIVLLNCIGKLLEKVIARRLQFEGQKFGVLHPCQYGGTMQHSTTDAGIQLVHNIRQAWNRGLPTSALLLDVAQFFPSIHHDILGRILRKQGFHSTLCTFFQDYLVGRTTQFLYNGRMLDPTDLTVGVGQGSALSPILSGLYIAPAIHLASPVAAVPVANSSLQFFVDDGLISVATPRISSDATTHDQLALNNAVLAHIFHTLVSNLNKIGLTLEPDKLELMHFTRADTGYFPETEPFGPHLAVKTGASVARVKPKAVMRYLGFFLDPKLSFRTHVRTYVNKACGTVHALRMLGNSVRGLSPANKRRLYISNVLPVALYGAQLWWHPQWKRTKWIARELQKVQARAGRWITGCFRTTPLGSIEVLARIIPIRFQVDKHMKNAALRTRTLHSGHPVRAALPDYWSSAPNNVMAAFPLATSTASPAHDSPLRHVDWIARLCNEDFHVLHDECHPGRRLRDTYHDRVRICADAPPKGSTEFKDWKRLTFLPLLREILQRQDAVTVFSDGSHSGAAKEHRTGAAWAIYCAGQRAAQGSFGYGKASPFDAEMAALARGLKAAVQHCNRDTKAIHAFVDNKSAVKTIFACNNGPAQLLSVVACTTARAFLDQDPERTITIHWCPAHVNVPQNEHVDKLAKHALGQPQPDFISMSTAKQRIRDEALRRWRTDATGHHRLGRHTLFNRNHIETLCSDKAQAKASPLTLADKPAMYARFTRFMTGHFPHGDFRARFNLPGPSKCECGAAEETQHHILYTCPLWIRPEAVSTTPAAVLQRAAEQGSLPHAIAITSASTDDLENPHPTPENVMMFLRLNPMVATFEWPELLAKRDAEERRGSLDNTYADLISAHTRAKVGALADMGVSGIYRDSGALAMFAAGWKAEKEAETAGMEREAARAGREGLGAREGGRVFGRSSDLREDGRREESENGAPRGREA